jgi:hypothetical protein
MRKEEIQLNGLTDDELPKNHITQKGIITRRAKALTRKAHPRMTMERFRDLRERLVPKGRKAGLHTDEDVFDRLNP